MMHAPLSTLTFFPVSCRDGSSLLRGRTRRALTAEEITKTCEVLLAAALRRRCRYWLLDGRVSPQEQPAALHEWLEEDYFPRVRAQLGLFPCIAMVVAPSMWQGLQQPSLDPLSAWPAWGARVGWFKEEEPALAWLRKQGAHECGPKSMLPPALDYKKQGEQLRFNF
ncbi:hypothetical protein [Hymenobacter arizonensis]|uniref:SpoIIAA-like n=1 Tax=Hymenobacter arizonensis TaxID=1227077 RepID=A0A1I5TZG5_HYMAR|nr:hypothetical protein [Hymenobacter arizonensis]SFP88433.1 hypothetical protein SAMN04515668_0680 [Hymenobacter arizonensis]